MKKYKAVFFDWDGTAVLSRKAPVEETAEAMRPLLDSGVKLVIISGTTMENIAGGRLDTYFTGEELLNLYLGLGRGAYNYRFVADSGSPVRLKTFSEHIPDRQTLLAVHRTSFAVHLALLERYDFPTDIVFTRPNYCKIDLLAGRQRGEKLFMQEEELDILKESLHKHGIRGGLKVLFDLALEMGKKQGIVAVPTCDAKYLEVGITSKSDNVDAILDLLREEAGIKPEECAFWGDEYVGLEPGIFGSDSFMITKKSRPGDFFDVSDVPGTRPERVKTVGGGVRNFLAFLRQLSDSR